MIAVRLMGGLGNQMFQYAAAKSLATQRNTEPRIDMTWFGNQATIDTPREYELNDLCIDAKPLSVLQQLAFRQNFAGRLARKLAGGRHFYVEPSFCFNPEFTHTADNTLLQGYFQSEKYFKDIRPQLLNEFQPNYPPSTENKELGELITASRISVSLHVRRGDYVSNENANKFHGTKGLDYYTKAIKYMENKVGKNFKLFIFSDDPNWCRDNLKFSQETVYVSHNKKGIDDMSLMKLCSHNVIANSSFSWWGAWLNQNPKKIVVAPKVWFADSSIDTSDVVPKKWVRL